MHNYNPKTQTLTLKTLEKDIENDISYVNWVSEISMLVETHQPVNILSVIDAPVANFDAEMTSWLEQCVVPIFNKSRVQKLAFVVRTDGKTYQPPDYNMQLEFEFSVFANKEDAEKWLAT